VLVRSLNPAMLTIAQCVLCDHATVLCQSDPLQGDERAWRGTDASAWSGRIARSSAAPF